MKFLLRICGIALTIFLAVGLLALLINNTFIKKEFKTRDMNEGIPIPLFLYELENNSDDNNYNFITINPMNILDSKKKEYLNTLSSCYGTYYYDENKNITITNYEIINNSFYKTVKIGLDYKNYCSENYVLSDTWIDEFQTSKIHDTSITNDNLKLLIESISEATRNLNPTINPKYQSKYEVTFDYYLLNDHYSYEIKDISATDILVKKTNNVDSKFAVYTFADALGILEKYAK